MPIDEKTITRQKATLQQAKLNALERRQNVKEAFVCRGDLRSQNIVLVDDVCTTGSTLEAAPEPLRTAEVASVWAFTLARARWEPGRADHTPDADSVQS